MHVFICMCLYACVCVFICMLHTHVLMCVTCTDVCLHNRGIIHTFHVLNTYTHRRVYRHLKYLTLKKKAWKGFFFFFFKKNTCFWPQTKALVTTGADFRPSPPTRTILTVARCFDAAGISTTAISCDELAPIHQYLIQGYENCCATNVHGTNEASLGSLWTSSGTRFWGARRDETWARSFGSMWWSGVLEWDRLVKKKERRKRNRDPLTDKLDG